MSDEYEFDTRMNGKVMQFTNGEDGDVTWEGFAEVQLVDNADGFVELAFDTKNPRRRNYVKVRISDLRRSIKATT